MTKKALALLLLCAAFGGAQATLAQPPPILQYVKHPDFESARLSPDGKHIALVVPRDDTEALMILDAATLQNKASFETRKNNGIYQYWWANEERIVFTTSIHVNGHDQESLTGDLFALNVDNTEKFILGGPSVDGKFAYRLLDSLENDRQNVLVARWPIQRNSIARSQPEALLMDIYAPPRLSTGRMSGERHAISVTSPLPWGELVADNSGEVRLAYANGEDGKLQVKLRQQGEWIDIADFLGVEKDDAGSPLGAPLGFNRDNTGVYHLARSPHGTVGIALFDIAAGQSNLLYAHERYDVTNGDLILSADGKELIGVTVLAEQPERHYFSEHPDRAFYQSLDKQLANYRINFLNFDESGQKGLAMVSSPTMPPGLFMLDRNEHTFAPLFSSMPKLQGTPMSAAQTLQITARDGLPVEAYFTPAAGSEGAAPLLVLVHGGPHGVRDTPVFNPEVKLLSSRGYAVLQVNYRGSGGYGLEFQQRGYQNWGKTMIDDIADATRHVVEAGLVDGQRVAVMGASYGAYAAMMALARYPELYRCGVAISGIYDLTKMRTGDVPFLPGGDAFLDQVVGTDAVVQAADSPVSLAGAIKVPVFLAHGGADRRAKPLHAERLKKAFDKADVDYEWFYVKSAGHGFALPENREKLYTDVFGFLQQHL